MAYLQASGNRFTLNGQTWYPFGGVLYGSLDTTAKAQARINEAVALGYTMMRIVNYFDARIPGTAEQTETIWTVIDYLMNAARIAGIKILMDLSDHWSNLYFRATPTVDTKNMDWTPLISWIASRVNTVNGLTYANDDAIGIISIAGELTTPNDVDVTTFYTTQSAILKTYFPHHVICTGGIAVAVDPVGAIANVDCVATHSYYPALDANFQPFRDAALKYNKPWFVEEFGQQAGQRDMAWARNMKLYYQLALRNNCQGFIFWNFYPGTENPNGITEDYNIGPNPDGGGCPRTLAMTKLYANIHSYSPRIPVAAVDSSGWY